MLRQKDSVEVLASGKKTRAGVRVVLGDCDFRRGPLDYGGLTLSYYDFTVVGT